MRRLEPAPGSWRSPGTAGRGRLREQPDELAPVRDAFHSRKPGADPYVLELFRYDDPTVEDRRIRTELARLLSLYGITLSYDDAPVLALIADLSM
ncbi:hypothetical protein ACIRQP_37055 [Streptomyces sp. NPDC102274]|uniref:hypothetical protein n=1 Tax=Streptomyces sp. NPDC102274 TaxID=3366151 RepID=UPI00382723E9